MLIPIEVIDIIISYLEKDVQERCITLVDKHYNGLYWSNMVCSKLNNMLNRTKPLSDNFVTHMSKNKLGKEQFVLCIATAGYYIHDHSPQLEKAFEVERLFTIKKDVALSSSNTLIQAKYSDSEENFLKIIWHEDGNFKFERKPDGDYSEHIQFETNLTKTLEPETVGQFAIVMIDDRYFILSNCIIDPDTGVIKRVIEMHNGYNKQSYCVVQ